MQNHRQAFEPRSLGFAQPASLSIRMPGHHDQKRIKSGWQLPGIFFVLEKLFRLN
jgi:hypothetical protein